MRKLGRIPGIATAGLMAASLAVPFVLAQTAPSTTSTEGRRTERQERWGRGEGRGHRGGEGRMFGRLNLTDAQKAQMKQIHQSFRERTQPLRQELHAKRQELRQANQTAFNETLTAQKLAEMSGLEAKLMGEQFKLRQETLALLTPEQKTELEQQREQFKSRRGGRRAPQGQ